MASLCAAPDGMSPQPLQTAMTHTRMSEHLHTRRPGRAYDIAITLAYGRRDHPLSARPMADGRWPEHALPLFVWYGHEKLFGFSSAAIAGSPLTAVATWTGTAAVSGLPLVFLRLTGSAGLSAG